MKQVAIATVRWYHLYELGYRQGIELVRYDPILSNRLVKICHRNPRPLKASIRRYCNESHNVVSAKNIHTALKERPVRGMTASVFIVLEQNSTV